MILAVSSVSTSVPWYDNDNILKYLIPTAVALIVFLFGVVASWFKDNMARRRESNNIKNVFTHWVPHIKPSVDTLADACSTFSKAVGASEELGAQGMKFNQLSADKLASISLESMIKTFITNSTGKAEDKNKFLYHIVSVLAFLEKKEPEIKAKYDEHYSSANELLRRWNEAFDAFSDGNIDLADASAREAEQLRKFNAEAEKVRKNWNAAMAENPQNTKISYAQLVAPFDKLLGQYIQENGFDPPLIGELSSTTQDLKVVYAQWQAFGADYASVFASYAKQLNESYALLETAVAYFVTASKVKWFCS